MSKSLKTILLLFSFLVLGLAVCGAAGSKGDNNNGAYRQLSVYSEVLSRIRSDYVEDPNMGRVNSGALHGLVEALDPDASYLSPKEYKMIQGLGTPAAGVGAAVSKRFGYGDVISVIPGGPGDKAGLVAGDIIEALDGKSTREMSVAELEALLGGPAGSVVKLSVVRPNKVQPTTITITREAVKYPPVTSRMMEDQIGYIRPDGFPKGRTQEIAAKLRELEKSGAKKIILDLRNSGDGDEAEGIATANLFLNHGEITYVQGQKYPRQNFTAEAAKDICSLPVVVIVNKSTAGPAEIVAGAILDNARGDVLGDKTFGEGSIEKTIDMKDGSAIILPVAKYYTPSGKIIDDVSITPNVLVADKVDDFVMPEDSDLQPDTSNNTQQQQKSKPDEQLRRAIEQLTKQKPKVAASAG